ncbi:MAG TPA: hypothetical protein VGM98_23135 [Schlesneria sp.]
MSRWILAMAMTVVAAQTAQAQVVSAYGGTGGVYVPGSPYAAVAPSPAVSSAYYSEPAYSAAPVYATAPAYAPPVYGYAPAVYAAPVYARPVYVAPSPIVPMAYTVPVYTAPVVVARPVYAAPVPLYGPNSVQQTTRALPHNYTQVTRVYGPTPGPHYSRVHVHNGPFGTTIRERVR